MPSNSDLKRELSAQMKKELMSKDKFFPEEKPNRRKQVLLGLLGASVLIASGSLGYVAGQRSISHVNGGDETADARTLLRGADTSADEVNVEQDMDEVAPMDDLVFVAEAETEAESVAASDDTFFVVQSETEEEQAGENTPNTDELLAAVHQSFDTYKQYVPEEETNYHVDTTYHYNAPVEQEEEQEEEQEQVQFFDAQPAPVEEEHLKFYQPAPVEEEEDLKFYQPAPVEVEEESVVTEEEQLQFFDAVSTPAHHEEEEQVQYFSPELIVPDLMVAEEPAEEEIASEAVETEQIFSEPVFAEAEATEEDAE